MRIHYVSSIFVDIRLTTVKKTTQNILLEFVVALYKSWVIENSIYIYIKPMTRTS